MMKKFCIIAIFAFTIIFSYMYQVNATTNGEYMSEYLATVKYEQKNGFTKDKINGSYYSQEYNIYIDNVEIQSYKIDILEGFPEGTYIANANTGEKQEEFSINETKFKIMVPIDEAEKDFIGSFKAYMDFKTYITYYTYEGELMVSEVNDSNEQIIKFDNRHSILTINAIDAETLEGVSGVTVQVKDNTFNLTEELVTDRLGRAIVNKIGSGKASIKVTDVPNEYVITGVEELKEIEHKDRAEYKVQLKRKKGMLRIENNAINSTFEIYNSKGNLVGKYSTDENGMIEIDELDVGNYLLIQKQLPKGYLPIENQIFTIYEGRTCHLLITNEIEEVVIPNEDEQNGNEEDKDLEENKEPSENEQDKSPDVVKPSENEQDKTPEAGKPNENDQDKIPDTNKQNEDEQDKNLETEKPHKRPHKHKLKCKCECCKKEQVEKPKDEEQNNNSQDEEKPNDNEVNKEVQDDSKGESNKTPAIKGEENNITNNKNDNSKEEENVSNDKENNSKEQEQDNEKETNNKVAENEEDTKTDSLDKQSNSNIDKLNLSTLPRTGDDYFLVKLIIFDIFMAAIFLLILNYKKQSAKKQTAFVSNIKE